MMTLLLVSLAVAVGAGVMKLGQAQVESDAVCPLKMGMTAAVIGGVEQICYDEAAKKISFVVENGVNANVEGILVDVVGANKALTVDMIEAKIAKAGSYVGSVDYDASVFGEIKRVKLAPQLGVADGKLICSEEAVVVESLRKC